MKTLEIQQPALAYTSERPRGLDFDGLGNVVGARPIQELYDALGNKLIAHYGEDFRNRVNENRIKRGCNLL